MKQIRTLIEEVVMSDILRKYIPDTQSISEDKRRAMDEDMYAPVDDCGDDLTPEETKRILEDYRP
jgi:hypothetical protein